MCGRSAPGWFKSSRSNPSQNCVEVRYDGETAGIRDSKNAYGPALCCAAVSLFRFVASVRRGELRRGRLGEVRR